MAATTARTPMATTAALATAAAVVAPTPMAFWSVLMTPFVTKVESTTLAKCGSRGGIGSRRNCQLARKMIN
jgi:hypothetical protein